MRAGIEATRRDDVLELRLARPEKLNPLGAAEWDVVVEAIDEAERSGTARAVVLRSSGRYFCAGNDLAALRALSTREEAIDYLCGSMLRGFVQLATTPLPVVTVIHADTAGGGIELAHYGDYVLAADHVRLSLPEARRGLFPSTLVAAVPAGYTRHAMARMAYTGEQISAAEARRLGLVHRCVPVDDLDAALDEALDGIRAASPSALAATKRHLNEALLRDGIPAVRRALEELAPLIVSGDGRTGLDAFARREPVAWAPAGADGGLAARRAELVAGLVTTGNEAAA